MLSEPRTKDAAAQRRVLVVDDDLDFAQGLNNLLTLEGYEVEMAHSAEEAVKTVAHFDAQVAILDYRLGATIGTDLVAPLGEHRPGIQCLLATAYADMDTAVQALRRGVYDYFGKPLNTGELLAALERCFGKIRFEQAEQAAAAALREAEKMRAVAQIAAGVSHHSNNLLMIILANAERLRMCVEDDPFAMTLTDELERAVDRAAEINRNLLTYARQHVSRPKALAVDILVSESADSVRSEFGGPIRVEIAAQSSLWPVHADPDQFKSAICAIMSNAREAMPDGGKLTIEVANVMSPDSNGPKDPERGEDAYVMVSVTDNGRGMAPEVAQRAFEPFFSLSGLAEKMGLGLSTAHGFATQAGGRITIDSQEGRGTTVKLLLPRLRSRNGKINTD